MPGKTTLSARRVADELYPQLVAIQTRPGAALASYGSLVSARQFARLYELAARWVRLGSEVLDWGCGTGHFSYYLANADYRVVGYSLFPCPLATALEDKFAGGGRYSFVQGSPNDPETLPFENGRFDAVFSLGVLEHVRETGGSELASLIEIARVVKPGGLFICYHLPNRWSAIEAGVRLLSDRYHHPYRYTRGQIRAFCDAAGLEPLVIQRYGVIPRTSLASLPRRLSMSVPFADFVDNLDARLSRMLGPIAQNHLLVARRIADSRVTEGGHQ